MTHRYDDAVARHYAAYRPPLHEPILVRLVPPSTTYPTGLDVGCGTGRSAVALARHCHRVTAIDPSQAMLASATPHPQVHYLATDCPGLVTTGAGPFACVTFAGSLVYAKEPALRAALPRLLAPGGHILIYDFEVLLDQVATALGLGQPRPASPYNHALGIADWPEFTLETQATDRVRLGVTTEQLAHIVLADSDRYDAIQRAAPMADPFRSAVHQLAEKLHQPDLFARLYYARYRLAPQAVG